MRKRACSGKTTISQAAVKAYLTDGSRTKRWLEQLEDDQWTVTSYDPITREVCMEIVTEQGLLRPLSITLPELSFSA